MIKGLRNYLRQSAFRGYLYRVLKACDRIQFYRVIYDGRIRSKANTIPPFPPELSIETTNLCDARCTICAHPIMKRAKGKMETELVISIIDQASKAGVRRLFLSGFGEPLLDKRLPDFVTHARGRAILFIGIVTNGSLLNGQLSAELIDAGLNEIYISADGFTTYSYEQVRPGLKFDQFLNNIKELHSLLESHGRRQNVKLIISVVDLISNKNEHPLARRLLGKYVDTIYFRQAQGWTTDYGRLAAGYSPHFEPNSIPCRYLWDSMSVYVDGRVPPCCLDYEAAEPMGNAIETPLAEIWLGTRFACYRQLHLDKRKAELEPCRTCGYYSTWW